MIKKIILLLLFILSYTLYSQDYKIVNDGNNGEPMILGYCPVAEMNDSVFSNTWTDEYRNYNPDYETLDQLEGKLDSINIKIVFRSTCSDSREQLPRFFKILNELNYPINTLTLIGVDHDKKALAKETDGLDIELVPTFIFYKNGIEIGRIVEMPTVSLEQDLLSILN